MKTCFIYADQIIDLEIVLNLKKFYERLGFMTCYSWDRIHDADLLVVLRPINRPLDLSRYRYSVLHIFAYEGHDVDKFLRSPIDLKKTHVFCMSEESKKRILSRIDFPADRIRITLLPVVTSLWVSPMKDIEYEVVHIGNHKSVEVEQDLINRRFHEAVTGLKADIWGADWEGFVGGGRYHGKARRFETHEIYARTRFALGLRYPFQRMQTYSSRYWEAPLNGCQLLSEPGLHTQFPGIVVTDYTLADLQEKMKKNHDVDRAALRARAKAFWDAQYQGTLACVRPTLEGIRERRLGAVELLVFARVTFVALMKQCFHTNFMPTWVRNLFFFVRDGSKMHVTTTKVPTLKDDPEPPSTEA